MIKTVKLSIVGMMLTALVACDTMTNQDVGALTGGLAGGALGSRFGSGRGQVLMTVGGAVAGSIIGSKVGQSMDKVDRMKMNTALETTKTRDTYTWQNPDTHNRYRVKPTKTYEQHGRPCREYVTEAWINGHHQQIHGTACRDQHGHWRAVN